MLTGDNPARGQTIAHELGIDLVYAGLMPEDKVRILTEIQEEVGPVAMVGDGVNDAPGAGDSSGRHRHGPRREPMWRWETPTWC